MPKITPLAAGEIAPHQTIEVRFIQANGQPGTVLITWPESPTEVSAVKIADVASAACRVLANASVELSRMKAGEAPMSLIKTEATASARCLCCGKVWGPGDTDKVRDDVAAHQRIWSHVVKLTVSHTVTFAVVIRP